MQDITHEENFNNLKVNSSKNIHIYREGLKEISNKIQIILKNFNRNLNKKTSNNNYANLIKKLEEKY
jgi:hypothetical protein